MKKQADIGFDFIGNTEMNGGVEDKQEMRRQKKQLKIYNAGKYLGPKNLMIFSRRA